MANVEKWSPERFGYSWDRFSDLTPEQERQFLEWTSPLPRESWRGARFLDAGCGAGRNSVFAMHLGAASGAAVDLDQRSLSKARGNLSEHPQVEVREQSIYDLDFAPDFDVVFSIGVVHHLADPELAVRALARVARPGGRVLIWVYGRENLGFYVRLLDPLRAVVFSRLPLPIVRAAAHLPSACLWLAVRLFKPRLTYLRNLRTFPYRHIHHIVFDQMLPQTANYWSRDEVDALLRQAGLQDITVQNVNDVSWAGVGTKARADGAASASEGPNEP